jgi:hypothetical protein
MFSFSTVLAVAPVPSAAALLAIEGITLMSGRPSYTPNSRVQLFGSASFGHIWKPDRRCVSACPVRLHEVCCPDGLGEGVRAGPRCASMGVVLQPKTSPRLQARSFPCAPLTESPTRVGRRQPRPDPASCCRDARCDAGRPDDDYAHADNAEEANKCKSCLSTARGDDP